MIFEAGDEFILFFFKFAEQIATYAGFRTREGESFSANFREARGWLP
jgi:hypothetical protein